MERVIVGALAVLLAGLVVRVGPDIGAVVAGTIISGAAIAVINVLLPVMVKRDAPDHLGLVTGSYVMTMTLGAALGAGASVPFAHAVGGGWRAGWRCGRCPSSRPPCAGWSGRAQRTLMCEPQQGASRAPTRLAGHAVLRDPVGRLLRGGRLAPLGVAGPGPDQRQVGRTDVACLILAIPTGLIAPIVAMRRADQRWDVACFTGLAVVGLVGLIAVPSSALLWMAAFGAGIGGTFPPG